MHKLIPKIGGSLGVFFLLGFMPISSVISASLISPDILNIINPSPNSKIKDTVNISWVTFDNNNSVVPYTITVYDSQTCQVTNYGQIASGNGTSSQTQNNNYSWNTKAPINNRTTPLSDGTYCIKMCAVFVGSSPSSKYTSCTGRNVTLINNNRLPAITSIPSNLSIFENQGWNYQIRAIDPDGDTLTYRFVNKPSWLDINTQTGLIISNSVNKNPSGADLLKYPVTIAVDDNMSGSVTQQFEITVKKFPVSPPSPLPNPSPEPQPSPSPAPQPVPPTQNFPTSINIVSPNKDTIASEELDLIWEADDDNGIKKITLEYSETTLSWIKIIDLDATAQSNYLWDIEDIIDGEYYLRISIEDTLGTITSKTSKKFLIKSGEDETPYESNPIIINVSPVNDSTIENRKPEISGDFVASQDSEIDIESFLILLNENEISELCDITINGFRCLLAEDLSIGLQKISVKISDTSKKETSIDWNFTIMGRSEEIDINSGTIDLFGNRIALSTLLVIIVICIVLFLLLVVPWVLYILWSRGKKSQIIEDKQTGYSFLENQGADNYGYYVPPYNPYSEETLQPETFQPNQAVADNVIKDISIENPPIDQNLVESNSMLTQAEPRIEFNKDNIEPVLPERIEGESHSLAQNDQPVNTPISENKSLAEEFVEPEPTDK